MASDKKLVPRTPNEVVVPVGKANLVTTKEAADDALEIAGRIFQQDNEEKKVDKEPLNEQEPVRVAEEAADSPGDVDSSTDETVEAESLVELTPDELKALPKSKFGRDKYGRALNKGGKPRKARNDKGKKRNPYGPRKPKSEVEPANVPEVAETTLAE
jgi:hypothetical protein